MITILEHEAILNNEIEKTTLQAQEKLEQIQTTMEEHMQKTLEDKINECQKTSELVLLQSQQNFMVEKGSEIEKCS